MKKLKPKKEQKRFNKGITLIALVITIIVLLILAGVSIAMLTGDNGILTQAQKAKEISDIAEVKEQAKLDLLNWRTEELGKRESTTLNNLKVKNIIEETNENNDNKYYKTLTNKSIITKQGNEILFSDLYEISFVGIDTSKTNPLAAMPTGASVIEEDSNKGIVIIDSNENEWVWVEVPKTIYTDTTYNGGTAPSNPENLTEEDYTKIETTMQNYATAYRGSYTDTFYSTEQHGFANSTEYDNWKNAMLKSVYENGGFWIGRYEVGAETAVTTNDNAARTPIIKQNAYPYNFVTCSQAQTLSKQLATGGKTSSLMFGIQWDLVLKFMEVKGYLSDGRKVTQDMLKSDSGDWGNNQLESFTISNENAKGTSSPSTANSWNTVTEKTKGKMLLTTGATERNSILNIYDLAGNVWEWTLEQFTTNTDSPCIIRGGNYSYGPAYFHAFYSTTQSFGDVGFRTALY